MQRIAIYFAAPAWSIGIAALFIKTFDLTIIVHACAALIGFIIPGHIANKQFNRQQPAKL